jgi:hypothetical protein
MGKDKKGIAAHPDKITKATRRLIVNVFQGSGSPDGIAGAEVTLFAGEPDPATPHVPPRKLDTKTTDAKGDADFGELAVGGYQFIAGKKGFGPGSGQPGVPANEGPTGAIRVELKPAPPGSKAPQRTSVGLVDVKLTFLRVRVVEVDATGRDLGGVPKALVEVVGRAKGPTDAGGVFEGGRVAPGGPFIVNVFKKGFGAPGNPVKLGTVNSSVTLLGGASKEILVRIQRGRMNVKGKVFYNRAWNTAGNNVTPAEQPLQHARAELLIQTEDDKDLRQVGGAVFLGADGAFEFKDVPTCKRASLRVALEHKDAKVVQVKGLKFKGDANPFKTGEFFVKDNEHVRGRLAIEDTKIAERTGDVNLGRLEVKHEQFRQVCDAYQGVIFGHAQLKAKLGDDLGRCTIKVPDNKTFYLDTEKAIHLELNLVKFRDVVLHEWGHFVQDVKNTGRNLDYFYNDDLTNQHGPKSEEHYESAWYEAVATFLACALQDDEHWLSDFAIHLKTSHSKFGPHSEGPIQEALWKAIVDDGLGLTQFWKALTGAGATIVFRDPRTVFDFRRNWQLHSLPDLAKLDAALKSREIQFGYEYQDGWKAVKAPDGFDAGKKQFRTVDELVAHFGSAGTSDPLKSAAARRAQYLEEFYNRNKWDGVRKDKLANGSTRTSPTVVPGNTYNVPVRKAFL